jgi:hypothetical protein
MDLRRTNRIWYEDIPLEYPRTLTHQLQLTSFSPVSTDTNNDPTFNLASCTFYQLGRNDNYRGADIPTQGNSMQYHVNRSRSASNLRHYIHHPYS